MFLNYLPSGVSEVVGITMVFAFLVGVILAAMFTADKGNTKNLYTKTSCLTFSQSSSREFPSQTLSPFYPKTGAT